MNALTQLAKPLAYLRIHHRSKRTFDLWIPLILALAVWAAMVSAGKGPALLGDQGLITGVNNLLQVLIGFYIAALAAIATFHKPGMDEKMAGDPVTLEEEFRGDVLDVSLTRRRFLCYLFGYLAWIGLFVYAAGVLLGASHEDIKTRIPSEWMLVARSAGLFAYVFLLANLAVTTLLGLYYMTHRIHLQEPKETTSE